VSTAVPAGNRYAKYATRNPAARRLVAGFRRTLDGLLDEAAPVTILDVGCGEGVLAAAWARRWGVERVVGVDVEDVRLRAEWAARARPGLELRAIPPAPPLPFEEGAFDLVAAVEVLEHVADPDGLLAELTRVARRHVLLSVPREPLWRALNLARGTYWRTLGNTPGHRHHFSRRSLTRFASTHGRVLAVRSPLPWTVALVQTAPAAAASAR
jgi:2-polyprenyl-3-methyl-5-hydroxy-6-metoxy-1,4-benzoquinol methylase